MEKEFEEKFYMPPKEFSPAPLWFWYGRLEKDKLSEQIDEMVDKGVYNAFMHPRAYFLTQYLEDEWWDIIDHVVAYSKEKGFHPWIYDEYAWPSGTAGSTFIYSEQKPSRVLAEGECNMAKGLRYTAFNISGPANLDISIYKEDKEGEIPFATIIMQLDECRNIIDNSLMELSEEIGSHLKLESGHFRIINFYRYIIPTAVDYLNKKTIETFIKYTHEVYKKRYGKHFGTLIPGLFFDEIFNAANKIVWTDAFEQEFINRKGYNIKKYLPLLVYDGGELMLKVRKDYYGVLAELYEEAFFEQIGKWCEENNILLTGHTEESLEHHPLRQGDYFRTMRHLHIPGGDCHDYRYRYPRKITPIESKGAVSVARLNRRRRMMSEALGGGGWATPLQEFKRGINVLAAMGINFFILHGFYYETDHQGSQGDWPASFFFQNPYWKNFKIFSEYISRLSFMGTIGKPVCRVGLLYPIASIYQRFRDGKLDEDGKRTAKLFNSALENLLYNQIDTDVIDELSIRNSSIEAGKLNMGVEEFEVIIVPDACALEEQTIQKLREFERSGGRVILFDCHEKLGMSCNFNRYTIKSFNQAAIKSFSQAAIVSNTDFELVRKVRQLIKSDFEILEGDKSDIHYYHRVSDGIAYFLIVNASDTVKKITARFGIKGKPVLFNIETGLHSDIKDYSIDEKGYTNVNLTLMEDEAYFIVFNNKESVSSPVETGQSHAAAEVFKENGRTIFPLHKNFSVKTLDSGWRIVPLPEKDNYQVSPVETETKLSIPIALFRSSLDTRWKNIRIQNREGEPGHCGRHLSRWKASWITRRSSWADESCEKRLYFRKIVEISEKVSTARLCIAAVNRFELYINGNKVLCGTGWRNPTECNVADYLKIGKNLIAVCVENDTPVQGKNMLETETFNPDTLTSLLLEGYIETDSNVIELQSDESWITCSDFNEGWETQALDAEAYAERIDVKSISYPWDLEHPEKWIFAWERGTPPILPWGNLPLFGMDMEFPLEIQYEITMPAGVNKIFTPAIQGNYHMQLDGRPIDNTEWNKGYIYISDSDYTRTLSITVEAEDFSDGLVKPIIVSITETSCILGDWRQRGLPFFSGSMVYKNSFTINESDKNLRCELDLGKVNFHGEVWVNGKPAGVRLWKPYILDITDFILPGVNDLSIIVSNLAGNEMRYSLLDEGRAMGWNRYWYEENIDRDSQNLESGLFGPVTVKLRPSPTHRN